MDTEQTFIRVQERFSQMLTPKVRAAFEYMYLFIAITLFCILVVMHANYVQQPGCSSQLSGVETREAQLIQIKITSAGLWSQNESESNVFIDHDGDHDDVPDDDHVVNAVTDHQVELPIADQGDGGGPFLAAKMWFNWIGSGARKGKLDFEFWKTTDVEHHQQDNTESSAAKTDKLDTRSSFPISAKETIKAAINHFGKKWHRRLSFIWRLAKQILRGFQKLWCNGLRRRIKHLNQLFYTLWKRVSSCYLKKPSLGIIYVLLTLVYQPGIPALETGYLYNFQTKEFYNLSYAQEPQEGPAKFGDYLVTKCGVLMMSLFVFFTTTMSVSFTLRETQTRMLKFTVQLQHHARHRLPTFQLIFVHVIESLVFVPIMIGILFFLFEFYDDQLLAFMVLILVWLCELFTLISVRTPISMKFFPRFFLLYFLVFHIYFFSYAYGFSYLALSTTAAFMQHLILYFWNRFEVPTLQRFMQNRRSQLQQHPDFHITSSTILASTVHITRLNTRNPGSVNADMASGPALRPGPDQAIPANGIGAPGLEQPLENDIRERVDNPMQNPGQADLQQSETNPNSGSMNSFSSLLLWILGGASSEGFNSFLSIFRDVRDQGQVYPESPRPENRETQDAQQ